MGKRLIVLDTETGGLDPNEHSILSLGMVVWHEGGIEDRFSVLINEGEIVATLEALKVNGLDYNRLREEGVGVDYAVTQIEQFLLKHDLYQRRVTLAGHNVPFDVGFLKRLYRLAGKADVYGKYWSHRVIDTQTLAVALELAGRVKWGSTSLNALTKHFSIKIREGGAAARHDSLEDAEATALLLNELLKFLKDPQRIIPATQTALWVKDDLGQSTEVSSDE